MNKLMIDFYLFVVHKLFNPFPNAHLSNWIKACCLQTFIQFVYMINETVSLIQSQTSADYTCTKKTQIYCSIQQKRAGSTPHSFAAKLSTNYYYYNSTKSQCVQICAISLKFFDPSSLGLNPS